VLLFLVNLLAAKRTVIQNDSVLAKISAAKNEETPDILASPDIQYYLLCDATTSLLLNRLL